MRQILVAGNWKMNKTYSEAVDFTTELVGLLNPQDLLKAIPIICPPYPYLNDCCAIARSGGFKVAAQDVSMHNFGAYTGEVSAPMLASIGVDYCLIGHSERRRYHKETDKMVREKLLRLREKDIIPVVCIGEQEKEREEGVTSEVILRQLNSIFKDIEIKDPKKNVIAYEPVWAIGTGKTATPEIAREVHQLIRDWLKDRYGQEISAGLSILYGGSIKPSNFSDLLKQPDIDGGLVGGASLDQKDFSALLETALKILREEK